MPLAPLLRRPLDAALARPVDGGALDLVLRRVVGGAPHVRLEVRAQAIRAILGPAVDLVHGLLEGRAAQPGLEHAGDAIPRAHSSPAAVIQ